MTKAVVGTILSAALTVVALHVQAQERPGGTDRAFEGILALVEAAQLELVRGRPEPFKALWSHRR